jgi:WD40 repeat protein
LGKINPQIELIGHKAEGFGLAWNPHEEGCLASGSEDKTMCLWYVAMSNTTKSVANHLIGISRHWRRKIKSSNRHAATRTTPK